MSIAKKVDNKLSEVLSRYDWLAEEWSGIEGIGNDLCSSKLIKGADWVLFYPNSENHDEEQEEFNTFQIYSNETESFELDNVTLEGLVEYVKQNAQNFGWEK